MGGVLPGAGKYANELYDAIELSLGELHNKAVNIGADGVIGVYHTVSTNDQERRALIVTLLGTAIKFY